MPGHREVAPYQPYDFDAANKLYVAQVFSQPDPVSGARSRTGIITCADPRCIPEAFFGLPLGEAFVIRNGGGRTASTDVIRTLAALQVISNIEELKVVHHTDCGALAYSDEWLRKMIASNDPNAVGGPFKEGALAWAESIAFQPFGAREDETERQSIERSVRQDVEYLKNHALVKPTVSVTGWIYNLHDGRIESVV